MRLLIDVSLTPKWVDAIQKNGFEAVDWSEIGPLDAPDHQILEYALENNLIVFTHDLDFGNILAVTSAKAQSVIQIRTENNAPVFLIDIMIRSLRQFKSNLTKGALITIHPGRMRDKILPIEEKE